MAARRRLYQTPWYKKFEPLFTEALVVRFDLIREAEEVLSPEQFVSSILPTRYKRHTSLLVEIVEAVDRKANADQRSNEKE